jgi:hypothetical protein
MLATHTHSIFWRPAQSAPIKSGAITGSARYADEFKLIDVYWRAAEDGEATQHDAETHPV